MSKTDTPDGRLGVFKQLSDVPESRRLYQHANSYEGNDIWEAYREQYNLSDRMSSEWELFASRWKEHVEERGRHHALARPEDVEAWSDELLSRVSVNRAYQHWNVIEGFYEYLKWQTEHPHTYNPFHMAATDVESSTRTIWNYKMEKRNV